jgi:hypothetical protein
VDVYELALSIASNGCLLLDLLLVLSCLQEENCSILSDLDITILLYLLSDGFIILCLHILFEEYLQLDPEINLLILLEAIQ